MDDVDPLMDSASAQERPGAAQPEIVREAERLFDADLNVFPVLKGSKEPYGPHSILTTTRLHRPSLAGLVTDSNLAVMMGRLSGGLFVLDCDSWETFQQIGEELATRGVRAWIRSGVDGGQYWLLCAEGEVKNAKIGAVDILGNRKYAVAPPSIHPEGMIYEWIECDGSHPPLVSLTQLDFLPLQLESVSRRRNREKPNVLPPVANRVLVERNTTGYASNSEAEYAACVSLVSAGFEDGWILRVFEQFGPPHYAKQGDRNFKRYVLDSARAWLSDPARTKPSQTGKAHSSVFIAWAESRAWPGRTGNTDRAVYLALCQRLRMDGGMPFRASAREVAQLAGVNKETACNALVRLAAADLVKPEGQNRQLGASLYSLVLPDILEKDVTRTVGEAYTPFVGSNVRTAFDSHDAWHSSALGKSALACWQVLRASPGLSVAHVIEHTGKTRPTVKRALAGLERHGLARAESGGEWGALEASLDVLDRIALELGTLGKAAERIERHQGERARFAAAVIQEQKRDWQRRQH